MCKLHDKVQGLMKRPVHNRLPSPHGIAVDQEHMERMHNYCSIRFLLDGQAMDRSFNTSLINISTGLGLVAPACKLMFIGSSRLEL